MHKSRLAGFIIDCKPGGPDESARLEQPGATRIDIIRRRGDMETPTGQRLCAVRPQHPRFAALARAWPA